MPSTELHQHLGPVSFYARKDKVKEPDISTSHEALHKDTFNMKYVEYPYSHRAIKKSQELHPQPQFPDFRVLVEIYRALWSEFSKGQLKQRRGTAV